MSVGQVHLRLKYLAYSQSITAQDVRTLAPFFLGSMRELKHAQSGKQY
jgi:hypothetical protein